MRHRLAVLKLHVGYVHPNTCLWSTASEEDIDFYSRSLCSCKYNASRHFRKAPQRFALNQDAARRAAPKYNRRFTTAHDNLTTNQSRAGAGMKAKYLIAASLVAAGLCIGRALAHGDVAPQPVDTTGLDPVGAD